MHSLQIYVARARPYLHDLSEEVLKILCYLQENLLVEVSIFLETWQIWNVSLQFYGKRILPQIFSHMGPAR